MKYGEAFDDEVVACTFSNAGSRLLLVTRDSSLIVLDADEGGIVAEKLLDDVTGIGNIIAPPSANWCAVLADGGLLILLSLDELHEVMRYVPECDSITTTAAFSPNERFLAIGSCARAGSSAAASCGIVRVVDVTEGTVIRDIPVGSSAVTDLVFAYDDRVYAACDDGVIWHMPVDEKSGGAVLRIGTQNGPVAKLVWDAGTDTLLSVGVEGSILKWPAGTGEAVGLWRSGEEDKHVVPEAVVAANGMVCVGYNEQNMLGDIIAAVDVVSASGGGQEHVIVPTGGLMRCAAIDGEARLLATGTSWEAIEIWLLER